jgi:hypothetical protein
VCEKAPLFVQQTVVPLGMVTSFCVYVYSVTLIIVSPALQPPAGRVEEAWLDAGRTTSKTNSASGNPLPIPIAARYSGLRCNFKGPLEGTSGVVPNLMA